MPELPEVYTITKDLKKYAENAFISDVNVESDYLKVADKKTLVKGIKGCDIIKIDRLAKNILLSISSGPTLTIHLGMTGRLLLRSSGFPKDKWQRLSLTLEKNNKKFQLRYCDMRMFGRVNLLNKDKLAQFKEKFGPEPIDETLTKEAFLQQIQSKRTNIKNALLDQSIISGMGNIYAIDALWLAKIHPETRTSDLNSALAQKLLNSSREILYEGIKNRGVSMNDYVDLFGKPGNQQNYFRIYKQENCPECQSKVEFIQLNGRGTYYCPVCQPRKDDLDLL